MQVKNIFNENSNKTLQEVIEQYFINYCLEN